MRGYGALTVTSPATASASLEPLSLPEVVKFLELPVRDPVDEEEQALLSAFILAARVQAEGCQHRDLVEKQYDLALDCFPCDDIQLRTPLVSVDLVRYRDSDGNYTTCTEGTDYIVDTARGLVLPAPGESWPSFTPWPSSAVLIRFTSGMSSSHLFWTETGAVVKIGMRQLISEYFNNRLPLSYDIAASGSGNATIDRIKDLLSFGAVPRCL